MSRSEVIQINLARFGITDIVVVGKVKIRRKDGQRVLRTASLRKMKLSQLCAESGYLRDNEIEHDHDNWERVDSKIEVFHKGSSVGYVDSDSRFFYESTSSLKKCLGWFVATDLGKLHILNYDLISEVREIKKVFARAVLSGSSKESLAEYSRVVDEAVKQNKGSFFRDAYRDVKKLFLKVVLRELRSR